MATMLAHLPAPTREYVPPPEALPTSTALASRISKEPPPYGSVERQRYIPRQPEDFGDGGAFPEIQVAQYPLGMGKKEKGAAGGGSGASSTGTLAVTVNADGDVNYDAIVRQGRNQDKIVYSDHKALVPKLDSLTENFEKPDEDEVAQTAKETEAALLAVVTTKLHAQQPKQLPKQPGDAQYIKYTPAQQGKQYNSGAGQRIVKMQDMPVDPMEPPKFRHKKVPRGAGSPPVPIMHSPPRPVSVKDQQDWKIPPCISNWKNAKGYTIPLDKRLAADGRGLQETAINDNFAQFTEALYVAEQTARQAVEMRSKVAKEMAIKEKAQKEKALRELADQARRERAGGAAVPVAARDSGAPALAAVNGGGGLRIEDELPPPPGMGQVPPQRERLAPEDREEARHRAELMRDRKRERERERRIDERDGHGVKKSRLTRDRDRDISEKIALGQAAVKPSGQGMYDQRLFNQDAGVASGLLAEDAYNMYDKPLFADKGSSLYRPKAATDDELAAGGGAAEGRHFKPDRGFAGVDYGAATRGGGGPVQFEKDQEEDPFGLEDFVSQQNTRNKNALGNIGKGGSMAAGGGGGRYEDYAGGSSRSRVDFEHGRR